MTFTNDEIRRILPHRFPFLLVDKITECEPGSYAKGIKCVSANEMQFMGHFPEMSVMPGVLLIESIAQTGAVALLTVDENKGKIVMFGGIKNARFKRPVVPGDTVELECKLTKRRGPIGVGEGTAKVDGAVAATAEFTFVILDNKEESK